MNWTQLLSDFRLGGNIEVPYNRQMDGMSEFETDYWRIVDCPAFRRLQDKTQVFPLDKSDFIRTRLTHSLEVSALGKQLVAMIRKRYPRISPALKEEYPFTAENAQAAADVVSCAGLLHDIGNPPFGHFGEVVLHAWFENHLDELFYVDKDSGREVRLTGDEIIADLKHFEGNAQAFRLLTKLHNVDSECGLNLTAAVLNTIVKYPTDSTHIDPDAEDVCLHKLGFYYADQDLYHQIAGQTGTYFDGAYHRHPLTFVLEAADDIAYATADLEDSYKKGLFTLDEFTAFFREEITPAGPQDKPAILIDQLGAYREEPGVTELQAFQRWVNYARHWLLFCASYGFTLHYQDIMEGTCHVDLLAGTFHEKTMAAFKKAMVRFTFSTAEILKLELSAETIIEGLMERLVPAAVNWEVSSASRSTKRKSDQKIMSLVSENHKAAYSKHRRENDDAFNLYLRLLLTADYISGMTDTYAKTLYQDLSGI